MPKFEVMLCVDLRTTLTVEAASRSEALQEAKRKTRLNLEGMGNHIYDFPDWEVEEKPDGGTSSS